MKEGEYQKPPEIPDFAYYHLPGPDLLIPSLPNWSHPRNIQYSHETKSIEFIMIPNKEGESGDTHLLVSIMKNKYPEVGRENSEAFLRSQFLHMPFTIDSDGVKTSQNGQFFTAQAEGTTIQNDLEKEFPFQWVFRSDTFNAHTGTYYLNSFKTHIDKMLVYRPSIRLIIKGTTYNPNY